MANPLGVAAKVRVKRKLDNDDSDYDSDISRPPPKRISPFHNTPQQKKETKRKILKISLRKMRGIDCPETFLRRSVLINNLTRSLQDDLKNDDKLWDRLGWGGNYDLDTISCRPSYHPTPHRIPLPVTATGHDVIKPASHTGSTLLTNAAPDCGVWTLSSLDDDAHLSSSESDRVTRDLAQSHERLAQTVERMTSSCADSEDCFSKQQQQQQVTNMMCCDNRQAGQGFSQVLEQLRTTTTTTDSSTSSCTILPPATSHLSHTASTHLPSDINKNTISTSSCKYTTSAPSCSTMSLSRDLDSNPSGMAHCKPVKSCANTSKSVRVEPPWCSDLELPDELTSPYAAALCSGDPDGGGLRPDTLLLDHMDSIPPIISPPPCEPPMNCTHQVAGSATEDFFESSISYNSSSNNNNRCGSLTSLLDTDILSWNMGSPFCEPCPSSTVCSGSSSSQPPPSVSPSGSCSTEVERMDSGPLAEAEKYTSQGLREFDVIYNNLVSVLIGGN